MKKILELVTVVILFASCSTTTNFYQVYQTQSKDAIYDPKKEDYYFEDKNIKILYNFWGDGGEMWFQVYNKTDKSLYVDLNKSHLIYNGEVLDYYTETTKTISDQSIEAKTTHYFSNLEYFSKTAGIRSESAMTVKAKPIIHIPPNSYSVFQFYKLTASGFTQCGVSYPSKGEPVTKSFEEKNSPINFRNYLTYDFSEAETNPIIVDHKFWVEKILYMQEALYKGSGSYTKDCSGRNANYVYSYPYSKSNNFYYRISVKN